MAETIRLRRAMEAAALVFRWGAASKRSFLSVSLFVVAAFMALPSGTGAGMRRAGMAARTGQYIGPNCGFAHKY